MAAFLASIIDFITQSPYVIALAWLLHPLIKRSGTVDIKISIRIER